MLKALDVDESMVRKLIEQQKLYGDSIDSLLENLLDAAMLEEYERYKAAELFWGDTDD